MHFLALLVASQVASVLACPAPKPSPSPRALYFLDSKNGASGVAALHINVDDGTLSNLVVNPTHQNGSLGLQRNASNPSAPPAPANADPLFSQNAIIVVRDYLFTVNSGSNTATMFRINPQNPTNLTVINSATTQGDFPIAIAYSPALDTACVLNSGTKAGVTCYDVDHAKGLTPITPLLPITLTQTNPPVGIFNTTSDIQFSPSGKYLMATVKGYTINTPGYIYIWPVVAGKVSTTPVISIIPEIKQDWGFSFLSETRVLITDFPSAYDVVNIDPKTYKVTLESFVPVSGVGTCWTAYSSRFNTVFLSLAGSSNLTMVDPTSGAVKGHVINNPKVLGSVDLALDRTYLYTLSVLNYISVTDLSGLNSAHGAGIEWNKEVQTFELGVPPGGSREGFTGLAIYPAS